MICVLAGCSGMLGYDELGFSPQSYAKADAAKDGVAGAEGGCAALTCEKGQTECGKAPDGCGGVLDCGSCVAPLQCGGAGPNRCGSDPCTPLTCKDKAAECGVLSDGCAGALQCGSCPAPQECVAGDNVCSAPQADASSPDDPCDGLSSGWYCGASSQHPEGDANRRYLCSGGLTSSSESCPNGCQVNASGTDDTCKSSSTDGCAGLASGWYCGASAQHPSGDANTRYLCSGGLTSSSESCPNGCQVNAAGTDDTCKSSSTDGCSGLSDGWYCGASAQHPSGDANKRYLCAGGGTSSTESCANGCQVNPPGTDDTCKSSTADGCAGLSSGWYCGASAQHPAGDGSTRYLCQGGVTSSSQYCPNGCQVNPPGNDDTCK